jgi:uncharacterized membrane protein
MENRKEIIDDQIQSRWWIFIVWLYETILIALLPLFVYGISSYSLSKIPPLRSTEWAMISTIIWGDSLRGLIKFLNYEIAPHQRSEDDRLAIVVLTTVCLLGIILSSVFLAFSVAEQLDDERALNVKVYWGQMVFLLITIIFSATTHLWIGSQRKRN